MHVVDYQGLWDIPLAICTGGGCRTLDAADDVASAISGASILQAGGVALAGAALGVGVNWLAGTAPFSVESLPIPESFDPNMVNLAGPLPITPVVGGPSPAASGGGGDLYARDRAAAAGNPVVGVSPMLAVVAPGDAAGLATMQDLARTGAGNELLMYLHESPITYTIYGSRTTPDGAPGIFGDLASMPGTDEIVRVNTGLINDRLGSQVTLGHELGHAALYDNFFTGRPLPAPLTPAWGVPNSPGAMLDVNHVWWIFNSFSVFAW